MLSRKHTKDAFDVIIRLTPAPHQGKEVVFLIDDVDRKIIVQEIMYLFQRVWLLHDCPGHHKKSAADIAVPIVLGEEPDQWFSQEFERDTFNRRLHSGDDHDTFPSFQDFVPAAFLILISACAGRLLDSSRSTIRLRQSASGASLSRSLEIS